MNFGEAARVLSRCSETTALLPQTLGENYPASTPTASIHLRKSPTTCWPSLMRNYRRGMSGNRKTTNAAAERLTELKRVLNCPEFQFRQRNKILRSFKTVRF